MLKELSYKQSDELDEIMQRYRKAKTAKQRALIKAELEEIKTMDKSELKSSEKKALRKEVRAINAELRSTGNGVYLSVGAIIIVILLLILLL